MRTDDWLVSRFVNIWDSWFSDVPKENEVVVRFKGKWKNKFGHIKMRNGITEIAVNGLFKSLEVPEEVIDLTIAHEIVHYSHGFQSPLEKKFRYPHQGGIVNKELRARGFKSSLVLEKKFMKNWWSVYSKLTGEKIVMNREPRIVVRYFK